MVAWAFCPNLNSSHPPSPAPSSPNFLYVVKFHYHISFPLGNALLPQYFSAFPISPNPHIAPSLSPLSLTLLLSYSLTLSLLSILFFFYCLCVRLSFPCPPRLSYFNNTYGNNYSRLPSVFCIHLNNNKQKIRPTPSPPPPSLFFFSFLDARLKHTPYPKLNHAHFFITDCVHPRHNIKFSF